MADIAGLRPIAEVASDLGLTDDLLEPYGRDKAKIRLEALEGRDESRSHLILVSAITPTPAGEGKTTTSHWPGPGPEPHG